MAKCELPKGRLHMTMPHVLRVLQLLGFPDSARFLLCPAEVSLLRQRRNYRHTHYLSLVARSLPEPETAQYSGYQRENWRQAAWVCLLALPLVMHVGSDNFPPSLLLFWSKAPISCSKHQDSLLTLDDPLEMQITLCGSTLSQPTGDSSLLLK